MNLSENGQFKVGSLVKSKVGVRGGNVGKVIQIRQHARTNMVWLVVEFLPGDNAMIEAEKMELADEQVKEANPQ